MIITALNKVTLLEEIMCLVVFYLNKPLRFKCNSIGVGRFRILGGAKGGQIPSRHMTS